MKTLPLLLVLATLLAGCLRNQAPDVATHYHSASGYRTDLLSHNLLDDSDDQPRELIWLNAARVFRNFRDYDLFLEVRYQARAETGFLDIRPGTSLLVIADGEELAFRGSGSLNRRHQGGEYVIEDALYSASAEDLRTIAYSDRVRVRVIGANGIVEREFAPENAEKFRTFVMRSVERVN